MPTEDSRIRAQAQELEAVVRPMIESRGLIFWGLEYHPSSQRGVLRIFVDGEPGVSIDELSKISRDVSVVLDVEDMVPGKYNLEVSSPGLERVFFHPDQLVDYIGQSVDIFLHEPTSGRRKITGTIKAVEGDAVDIETEDGELVVGWGNVKKAKLRFDFNDKSLFAGKKKK